MKELSIEEKANAYDNVRNKIATRFGTNVAQEIFSEFEMSEDEKTRIALISFLKSPFVNENITDEKVAPWLDWLEKQADVNSKEYVFRPLVGCDINTAAVQAVEQQKLGKKIVLAFNGAYIPVEEKTANDIVNEYYSWLEKQGSNLVECEQDNIEDLTDFEKAFQGMCCDKNKQFAKECCKTLLELAKKQLQPKLDKQCCSEVNDIAMQQQGEQKEILCDKCRKEHPSHSCQDITELGRCAVEHEQKPTDIKIHEGDKNNPYDMSFEEAQYYISERGFDICCVDYPVFVDDKYILQTIGNILKWADDNPKRELNIKPKFKAWDWVVNKGHSYLIAAIDFRDNRYLFEIGGYTHEQLNWEYVENVDKNYHLWSIEDAKPGDVLVSQYNKPFIYNGNYDEYKVGAYCGIDTMGEFIVTYAEMCWTNNESIKPATKEQRDMLFQKMHEAGYTFDFEKKELKKIKFKVGDEVITKNEGSLTITKIDKEGYWSNDLFICDFDEECIWDLVEQKPADKVVGPKFKVGDWVVFNNHHDGVYQVEKIENYEYTLRHFLGGSMPLSFSHEDMIRAWVIQDAKPGDVLHSTGWHNDCIFIFNGLDNWKFDEPNGDRAVATGYCCLFVSADKMEFGIQGPGCVEVNTIKPATKIQRDLLFRKMKVSGYEWDTNKKELKLLITNGGDFFELENCEQKPTECIKFNNEFENQISHLLVSVLNREHEYNEGFVKYVAQSLLGYAKNELKPTEWSEEDEDDLNNIIWLCNNCIRQCELTWTPSQATRIKSLIERIKDTVFLQPKQEWKQENREELTEFENAMMHIGGSFFGENAGLDPNDTDIIKEQAELLLELAPKTEWSEEDEEMLRSIIATCELAEQDRDSSPARHLLEMQLDWLKFLKYRCTCKPSNELDEASYRVGIKRVLENPESYGLTKYNCKPSDEQMEALEHFIIHHNGSTNYAKDLEELRIQLKKLKGE